MDAFFQDVRYGLRVLRKSPGFTFIAILTLAVGIGANTAIFSVVNTVLLARLPYRDPNRLVMVWGTDPLHGGDITPVSPAVFAAWKSEAKIFSAIGASADELETITGDGAPEMVLGYDFSADYFRVVDAKPALGRTFLPEEDRVGGPNVAVLSDELWHRRYGADPAIIGKTINIGHDPYTVVGVMSSTFHLPSKIEIWTPLRLPDSASTNWKDRYLRVVARLAPGVTIEQAQAQMSQLAARLAREHPDTNTGESVLLRPLRTEIAGDIRLPLLVLLGTVAFVLLIACANVANLLLARSAGREREIAVRIAVGASRARVARQMFTEHSLLSIIGGVTGFAFAFWGRQFLLSLFPNNIANLNIPTVEAIPMDARVFAFSAAATLATAIFFGLIPLLRSSGWNINDALKESGRTGMASRSERRLRNGLVVTEIALSFMLLIGAGLLMRSFLVLSRNDLGFRSDHVLALEVFPSPEQYPSKQPEKLLNLLDQSLQNLRTIPGVESVAATNYLPLTGFWNDRQFSIEGRPTPRPGEEPTADNRTATPGYFSTMGIPLLRGRDFTASDKSGSPHVAIVSSSLAHRYWGDTDPIGKRLNLGDEAKPDFWQIVGVVDNVHAFGTAEKPHDDLYRPFSQVYFPLLSFTLRTKGDASQLAAAAKAAIWAVDPQQPFYKVITMDELATESIALRRVNMLLVGAFSVIALGLAALGIYGVLSYSVTLRTREMGVRSALGATPYNLLQLILGGGVRLIVVGMAIGLAGALSLGRVIASLLFGIAPVDPIVLSASALAVAISALVASYIPARRATRVDPMVALRYE